MPVPKEVQEAALHKVGDTVHYQSAVQRVLRRYYRQSTGEVIYDLVEIVRPPARPRHAFGIPEKYVHKPTLHTLGLKWPGR